MDKSSGSSVLIIEDELLIAMDLEQMLQDLGFETSVLVSSCLQAEKWLAVHTPLFAVLDIRVRDGTSESIAHRLVNQGIPFIVSSGTGSGEDDAVFAHGIRVPKPCDVQHIADALKALGVRDYASSLPSATA
ncbi:response regulator (plasmid) [Rhizobium lusitanum]|uniref:response regulator n=1 Tax=Rhizobium lusitanum TaxID=293958 RepID=UPI00160CB5D6|nr:response regulator [Rhizobium lusitanum]QND44466.1 response regulator [Rhizobium lusitanum]